MPPARKHAQRACPEKPGRRLRRAVHILKPAVDEQHNVRQHNDQVAEEHGAHAAPRAEEREHQQQGDRRYEPRDDDRQLEHEVEPRRPLGGVVLQAVGAERADHDGGQRDKEGKLQTEDTGRKKVARREERFVPLGRKHIREHAVRRFVERHADDGDDRDIHEREHDAQTCHHRAAKGLARHAISPPIAFCARLAAIRVTAMMMLRIMSSTQESAAP